MAIKHTFLGKNGQITKNLTPLSAIRQKCLECSNWSPYEVAKCVIKDCALFPFRSGKSGQKRDLTDEQREILRQRLKRSRNNAQKSI